MTSFEEMVQPRKVDQEEDKMDDWSDDDDDDDFCIPTQKVKAADSWGVGNADQDGWSDVEEQNDDVQS